MGPGGMSRSTDENNWLIHLLGLFDMPHIFLTTAKLTNNLQDIALSSLFTQIRKPMYKETALLKMTQLKNRSEIWV